MTDVTLNVVDNGSTVHVVSSTGAVNVVESVREAVKIALPGPQGPPGNFMYADVAAAAAASIPGYVLRVYTVARDDAVGLGGAWYRRRDAEPPHSLKFQDALGAWWEIDEPVITAEMAGAVGGGSANDSAAIQLALDAASSIGSGVVAMPGPRYGIGTSLLIPDNTTLKGASRSSTVLVPLAGLGSDHLIANETENTGSAVLAAPGIVLRDFTIDCASRADIPYLSNLAGAAIADPEADYRVGGCLAPTTFAELSLTITDGVVTGVTIDDAGSGYVSIPAVWVTDATGYGCNINVTISAGALATATIASGGVGYTAPVAEVAGGGADPVTALYASNRRNPNFTNTAGNAIRLRKCISPLIENVAFLNIYDNAIVDQGNDGLVVRRCHFENGGKADWVGSCIWSQSRGDPESPGASFRFSTNTTFESNTIKDWRRSVATVGSKRFTGRGNITDGWGESHWFINEYAEDWHFTGNRARGGRFTDIVSAYIEGNNAGLLTGDHIADCHGNIVSASLFGGIRIDSNTFVAPPDPAETFPFGPFSERVSFSAGSQPVAGAQIRTNNRAAILYQEQDSDPGNAPKSLAVINNRFSHDEGGAFLWGVTFAKGASDVMGGIRIEGNDIWDAPGMALYDADLAYTCLDAAQQFVVRDNIGPGAATRHRRTLNGNQTLTATTDPQPWFTADSGAPLRAKSLYRFKGFLVQQTGTTSHNIGVSFGGTATLSRIRRLEASRSGTVNLTQAGSYNTLFADAATAIDLSTGITNARTWLRVEGELETDTAGTLIPMFTWSALPGGTIRNEQGTFFEIELIGIAGTVNSGDWA